MCMYGVILAAAASESAVSQSNTCLPQSGGGQLATLIFFNLFRCTHPNLLPLS